MLLSVHEPQRSLVDDATQHAPDIAECQRVSFLEFQQQHILEENPDSLTLDELPGHLVTELARFAFLGFLVGQKEELDQDECRCRYALWVRDVVLLHQKLQKLGDSIGGDEILDDCDGVVVLVLESCPQCVQGLEGIFFYSCRAYVV